MKKPKKKKVTIEDLEKLLQEIKAERVGRCPCCGRDYESVPNQSVCYWGWGGRGCTNPFTYTINEFTTY